MSVNNPEYDFKWCPGCGDFGVRRALEKSLTDRKIATELPMENNVVVAGIGCSGNLVHLLEGARPYGFHGVHGRSLPAAMGIKMGSPDLNVIVVAGDGDFLSIGMEHIAPQAARNLNVTAVIMDNAVYGLTKGQSSPTSEFDMITSSTPYGKQEEKINPLKLYLEYGVSFVASMMSSKIKDLSNLINIGMDHKGFSIVHVQSPCTTYNDTYQLLKGNKKLGIAPIAWEIPEAHDKSDINAAHDIVDKGGVPLGILFEDKVRASFDENINKLNEKVKPRNLDKVIESFSI